MFTTKLYRRELPTKLWVGEIYKGDVVIYSAVHAYKYIVKNAVKAKLAELKRG